MSVLDEILASLHHDAPVLDVSTGPRSSLVETPGGVGLAYRHRLEPGTPPPRLPEGASLQELARLARSRHPVEASVGVAAVNAALRPEPTALEEGNGYQLLLELGRGRDVALVGHFSFVARLRAEARTLWVLELEPEEGDLPAAEAARVIPRADLVAITGSTLVNHTLDELLALARGKPIVLLGPSAVFSPVLFDHGVTAICGALVRDLADVRRTVREGGDFRCSTGVRKVIWRRELR